MINLAQNLKNIKFLNQLQLDSKKIMLIVIMSAAVFYMDFNFIIKAQLQGLNKSDAEITKLRKDLDNFKKDLKNTQDLRSRQALVSGKPSPKDKKVISENQFAALLQDISKAANDNEVRIFQIRPSREAPGNNQVKSSSSLIPFFIILDLSSGYHNLGKFINELENLQAFVGVKDIKIAVQEDNYLKQRVNLVLYTYVKK